MKKIIMIILAITLLSMSAWAQEITLIAVPYVPKCNNVHFIKTKVVDIVGDSAILFIQELDSLDNPVTPGANVSVPKLFGTFQYTDIDTSLINPFLRGRWGFSIKGKK